MTFYGLSVSSTGAVAQDVYHCNRSLLYINTDTDTAADATHSIVHWRNGRLDGLSGDNGADDVCGPLRPLRWATTDRSLTRPQQTSPIRRLKSEDSGLMRGRQGEERW